MTISLVFFYFGVVHGCDLIGLEMQPWPTDQCIGAGGIVRPTQGEGLGCSLVFPMTFVLSLVRIVVLNVVQRDVCAHRPSPWQKLGPGGWSQPAVPRGP